MRNTSSLAGRMLAELRNSPIGAARAYSHTLRSWLGLFSDVESIRNYRHLHNIRRHLSEHDRFTDNPKPLRPRSLHGHSVYCRPGTTDINVFDDTFRGLYHLPPSDITPVRTILDLGSNIGLTIAHYAHLYGEARVLGIELDHSNFQVCRQNLAPYSDRCSVLWGAAWSHDGEVAYEGQSEWGYRVLGGVESARRVSAFSVESLIDRFGTPMVDFVKMDIEGAERVVLAKPDAWIHRVRCLKVEIHEPYSVGACSKDLERVGLRCELDKNHPACIIGRRS